VNLGIFTSDLHHLKSDIQVIREMATAAQYRLASIVTGKISSHELAHITIFRPLVHVLESALVVGFGVCPQCRTKRMVEVAIGLVC
jgi:tryptophan synthase alpha subunit